MRKYYFLLFLFSLSLSAQNRKYWVQFKDKANSPFSLANPSAYLSQRAIDRRANQGIMITVNDLPVNPSYINGVKNAGATILNSSKWLNGVTIEADSSVVVQIQNLPYVAGVEFAAALKKSSNKLNTAVMPLSISSANKTAALQYGQSLNQVQMIGIDCVHEKGYTGSGMVIAVLDAGYFNANNMTAFDSLRSRSAILGTWDFVKKEASVYEDNAHGTLVLSCMGANRPGEMLGTAPSASYWLLRTEDTGSETMIEEYNWASGAEFADSVGADIINSSLGYNTFDDPLQNHAYADLDGNTTPITRAADMAASTGMIVVNSAGNEGGNSWGHITVPADADSVLAVGAVDPSGMYAGFSSTGPTSDGRIKPNVMAQGSQAVVINTSDVVGTSNGTSFASPITAGAVACLWQAHPKAKNMDVIWALEKSAAKYANPDAYYGYGIPNFCVAHQTLSGNTGINTNEDGIVQFFPNPYHDGFSFSFYAKNGQSIQITVYDLSGRLIINETRSVRSNSLNEYLITPEVPLSNGVYLLSVSYSSGRFTHRIVKM